MTNPLNRHDIVSAVKRIRKAEHLDDALDLAVTHLVKPHYRMDVLIKEAQEINAMLEVASRLPIHANALDALRRLWQSIITLPDLSFITPEVHAAIEQACDVLGVTNNEEKSDD